MKEEIVCQLSSQDSRLIKTKLVSELIYPRVTLDGSDETVVQLHDVEMLTGGDPVVNNTQKCVNTLAIKDL